MFQTHRTVVDARDRLAELAAGALLLTALVAGGGSRGTGDAIVTLIALPTVALACVCWSWRRQGSLQRFAVLLIGAAAGWHLLQLAPVSTDWIARLPMRSQVVSDLRIAGVEVARLPATLDVWGTVRSLIACVVFGALWMLLSTLTSRSRLRLLKLVTGGGSAMALLGYAQAGAGQHSLLRLYDYHHSLGALGTFANRNHFADLMAMLVPIAFALAASMGKSRRLESALWYLAAILLLLAAGLSFSRTGFLLACASALAALFLIAVRHHGRTMLGAALVVLGGAGMISIYAWKGLSLRLQQDPLKDLRWQYLVYGLETAKAYFPWGSGPGSFRYVYAPFEPAAKMVDVYALHAHNDLVEITVEWGMFGIVFVAAVVLLLLIALRNKLIVVRDRSPILIGSAISVTVPMLHSLVDYPLRTCAVMAVFALASSIVLSGNGTNQDQEI